MSFKLVMLRCTSSQFTLSLSLRVYRLIHETIRSNLFLSNISSNNAKSIIPYTKNNSANNLGYTYQKEVVREVVVGSASDY